MTGAGGLIAGILMPHLAGRYVVLGLDLRAHKAIPGVEWVQASVADERRVTETFSECSYVIHLATGASDGWDGLLEVDIVGTRSVLECAASAGVRRVIFASTNHVAGGIELDRARLRRNEQDDRVDVFRPDRPYGAAKAFGEAYGRFISETTTTCVSCLRIGSVRSRDLPADDDAPGAEAPATGPFERWPADLLTPTAMASRLRRTWLSHEDLVRIVDEELASSDRFRLRWAVSDNPGLLWPLDVYSWNP